MSRIQSAMDAVESGLAREAKAKKVKGGAPKAKIHAPRSRPCHNSFTRKCLSKESKILFHGLPSWFMEDLVRYERAMKK